MSSVFTVLDPNGFGRYLTKGPTMRRTWNRTTPLILLALACLLAGCAGSSSDPANTPGSANADTRLPAPPPVSEPVAAEIPARHDPAFETVLAPLHDVEVFARLDGQLTEVHRDVGARVRKGDVLARIDDRELRAVLEEREAEVARMESAWERGKQLFDQGVVSERDFIEVRSDWEVAKARRDQAAVEHEWCEVRAPIDGVVALRRVQSGQLVKEDDLLFRISDPDLLRAELLLPEGYVGRVKRGHRVRLIPIANGGAVEAAVTRVSPIVDPGTGAVRVMIDFDNRRARMPAGMTVHVEFEPALSAQ